MKNLYQKLQLKKMKLLATLNLKFKLYEKYSDKSLYPVCLSMGTIAFQVLRCAVTLRKDKQLTSCQLL
jgi:hypothetical protein